MEATVPSGPYVVVLGTAQDAGLPQMGSQSRGSVRARRDPRLRRLVASVLLADPSTGRRWLFDATPDLRTQVELADAHPVSRSRPDGRPPLFDGIFLTHAHMGHYTGLLQLGREAYAAERQPVHCSARMCALLAENAPWDLLVREQHIALAPFEADRSVALGELTVTPIEVPHRAEYTDTFGFLIAGPNRSLLYIPDIDKWERWHVEIESLIARVDVALLDGTFYEDGEIPGRAMADIPHPFMEESVARFSRLPQAERSKIVFTHLNHTNPAADPTSAAAERIRGAGMSIAHDGQIFEL